MSRKQIQLFLSKKVVFIISPNTIRMFHIHIFDYLILQKQNQITNNHCRLMHIIL